MNNQNFTIEKSQVECYKIRIHERGYWADITLDSQGTKGRINVASDFGNFSYFWGACGVGFKEFLTRLNIEYAADKFNMDRSFSLKSTLASYKKSLQESMVVNALSKDSARDIFNEIEELSDCSNLEEFVARTWNQRKLMNFFDGTPEICYQISPQFQKFWTTIWPIFIDRLHAEIALTEG